MSLLIWAQIFIFSLAAGTWLLACICEAPRPPSLWQCTDVNGRFRLLGIPRGKAKFHLSIFAHLPLSFLSSVPVPLGIIQTIQRFSHGALVAGILGIIATVGWAVQGLGNAFYYRQVIIPFSDVNGRPFTVRQIWAHHTAGRSHNGKGRLKRNCIRLVFVFMVH